MKLLFTAFLALVNIGAALAQSPEAAASYNAFKLVRTRNIFDPERRPIHTDAARATIVAPRANFIVLTGTLATPGKTLAFFRGSLPEHSKVIGERETIAEWTVKSIGATQAELERAGKTLILQVGQQASLDQSGAAGPAAPATAEAAPAIPPEAVPPQIPAAASDNNDVLRRMMERRAKELSK